MDPLKNVQKEKKQKMNQERWKKRNNKKTTTMEPTQQALDQICQTTAQNR